MRRILVALAAAAILSAVQAGAEDKLAAGNHLVTPEAAQARLVEAGAARQQDLATVDAFLASPEGMTALSTVGVSGEKVRGSLGTLSDAELHDVAARAAALQEDPVAGAMTRRQWVWIGAAVAAVILLIILIS